VNSGLKPLDVLVLLKLLAYRDETWSYSRISSDIGVVPSQISNSLRRCESSRLLEHGDSPRPYRPHVTEFLIHGVKYCFPAATGSLTRGIPTSYAAPPLSSLLNPTDDPPPVWPYSHGEVRGIGLTPIHRAAPEAALRDGKLYQLLALVDAIRTGRARERELAARELSSRIEGNW
jgi:hypothetical protein